MKCKFNIFLVYVPEGEKREIIHQALLEGMMAEIYFSIHRRYLYLEIKA